MPEKNPYESQETLDIPDFIEQKKEAAPQIADSQSVDMKVFQMEETGEIKEEEIEERPVVRKNTRRVKDNIVQLGAILLGVLALLTVICLIFALTQHSALKKKQADYDALTTQMNEMKTNYETQIRLLEAEIEELKTPKEPTPSGGGQNTGNGTRYVVTATNGINLRKSASVESELVGSVDQGTEFTVVGDLVSDGEGRQWGKIRDDEWICIINGDEVYAEIVQ